MNLKKIIKFKKSILILNGVFFCTGVFAQNVNINQGMPPQTLPPLPVVQEQYVGPDFDKVLENTLVLDPSQIKKVRKEHDLRQKATNTLANVPPKQVTSLITASTAPGSAPPVLRLFPGLASSLVITDSTGAPWPIDNFVAGHKDFFSIKRLDGINGSVLSIVPLQYYANSNLILSLKGLSSPITVSLISSQKEVDFRTDMRVQGKGPNAQLVSGGLPSSTNTQLLSVLEGVAPDNSKNLKTSSTEAQAWMGKNGRLYIRTSLPIISPGWIGSVRSNDGTSAYEMMPTTSFLVMINGEIKQVGVEGW